MCVVCQAVSLAAAALIGILPVASPDSGASHPVPAVVSPSPSQTTSIAGTTCKTTGQIRNTPTASYRCTAVGRRKTWKLFKTAVTTLASTTSTTTTTIRTPAAGDSCTSTGQQVANSSGVLECRPVSGSRRVYVQLSTASSNSAIPSPPQAPAASRESFESCKILDQRSVVLQPWNVAFPLGDRSGSARLPATGVISVALIAVDFSDAVGTAQQLAATASQVEEVDRWLNHHSNSRLSFSWRTRFAWTRMPRASTAYVWTEPGRQATAQMILDATDASFDYSGIDFVFVLLPSSIGENTRDGVAAINRSLTTAEGTIKHLFGGGKFFYEFENGVQRELWSAWIHELLHPVGLPGHGIRGTVDIMNNQNGKSVVLGAWDSYLLGWLDASENYCILASQLGRVQTRLVPLERRQRGLRSLMVRLNDSQVIVVESRRAEGWGTRLGAGQYGLLVYVIDATQDIDRSSEGGWDGLSGYQTFAAVLRPSGVSASEFKTRERLVYQGESVTFGGVTIELTSTGDTDLVTVTR